MIIGAWGKDARDWRCAVSLIQFEGETGPGVMVRDADNRAVGDGTLAGTVMRRNDVIGTPFAKSVFAPDDAALQQDPRLAKFLRKA